MSSTSIFSEDRSSVADAGLSDIECAISVRSYQDYIPEESDLGDGSDSMHHFRNSSPGGTVVGTTEQLNVAFRESFSYSSSPLRALGGALEEILIMNILPYADAKDLCRLACVSSFLRRVSQTQQLWSHLYTIDFFMDEVVAAGGETMSVASTAPLPSVLAMPSTTTPATPALNKAAYSRRFGELMQRIEQSKEEKEQAHQAQLRLEIIHHIENILDLFQVRIIMPFVIASIFLSITLLCLKIDGDLEVNIIICFVPFLAALLYGAVALYVVKVIYRHQFKTESILRGMWNNFSGPMVLIFVRILGESVYLMCILYTIIVLVIGQIVLVFLKLSVESHPDVAEKLPWGIIFIPIWLLLTLYCLLPLHSGVNIDLAVFISTLLLLWAPLFILFVCLTLKLDGQEEDTEHADIRLALVLIPFWIFEGFIILISILFLIYGLIR